MAPGPSGPLALWGAYLRALDRTPVKTKSMTSLVMFVATQIIAQYLTKGKINSYRKILDFAAWGACNPVAAHSWQNFLAKHGPSNLYVKLAFDHFLYRFPILVVFQLYSKVMEGNSFAYALEWVANNNLPLQRLSVKLWPTVNILNYTVVPLPARVLYQNVFVFAWSLYLCLKEKWLKAAAEAKELTDKSTSATAGSAGAVAATAPAAAAGGVPNLPLGMALCALPPVAALMLPQ